METRERLIADITALYERGYINSQALAVLPAEFGATVSEDELRRVLRLAGFTDGQIDTGNYQ